MEQLQIGVVGAVGRGSSFLTAINANPHACVAAVCDLNAEGVITLAAEIGVAQVFTEYEAMLDTATLDAVMVCTPMPLHVSQSILALERNIHVFSEVPAAISLEEARALVHACANSRARYMMAENYCYYREAVLVRALARAGLFGTMYFAEGQYIHELKELNETTPWRRKWQTGINGCTYPTHSLGPILQWMDERVVSVCCVGSGHHYRDPRGAAYENEDSITMLCRLERGGLAQIRVDMLSNRPHNMTYYSLQGTNGCYEAARGLNDQAKIWLGPRQEQQEMEWMPLEALADEYLPEEWRNPSEAQLAAGHDGSDYVQIQDFIACLLEDRPMPVGIHEAMDMTLPGLISQQSIAQGSIWLHVPDSRGW